MRTITNVFLLNLAISDILLGVFCMPVTLVGTLLRHFIFGEFFCKLIQFSQAASVAISSWTLVAISCERYYAICHPLRSRRWQTRSHAYKTIGCIWCGSMLCMLPIAIFSQLMPTSRQGLRKCRENWPSYAVPYERSYNIFLDLVLLVLPLMILSVAYILITRTLYVGMRIEKAMIFGGRQEDIHGGLQRKSNSSSFLKKSSLLSTTSLSMRVSTTSRLKLNLPLRCHEGVAAMKTATSNNINGIATNNHQGNLESNTKDTDLFCQQLRHHHKQQQQQQQYQHQHNHNQQFPTQRLYQQHNFQNYQQQHQIVFREGGQQQQQQHQHQSHSEHHQSQHGCCCEPLSRFCCRSSISANSGRPHLYCMRFATLKATAKTDTEGNANNGNFCTADCCNSSGSTARLSTNTSNSNLTPATITSTSASSSSPSSALTTTSSSAMHRYQMQQQQHQQHVHAGCYCMVQQIVPHFSNKADAKKYFNKKSLRATESVLRRNNIAKNLESKKRVVKMLFVLVLEFFICWTPLYVINTAAMYIGAAIYEYIDYTSISVLQLLAYSSSCCNPITYCFMNANFRRAFCDTFRCMQWCGKRFQRKRSTAQTGANLCLAGSIRVNSCTIQTVIESPRL